MANTTSTTTFKADISQLKSQMQAAKRQVQLVNSEFKAATAGMEDWTDSADGLKAKLTQLEGTLKSQKTQLSLLEEEYEKTTTEYGENSAAADRVKISINNMKASIANTESQIDSYNDQLDDLENGGDEAADSMDELEESTAKASDGFTVYKGVLADLVSSGIKACISALKDLATEAYAAYEAFDEGQDIIVEKTGATGEALEELTDTYVSVMSNVITESDNAGNAIGTVASKFDLTGDALEELSTQFIKFSDLNNTDVVTSIENVQSACEAWGIESEDVSDFLDLLNATAQETGASVDDLSSSLTTNAASLKDMNFNVEDAVSFLGDLETSGVDSTTVLAGLKKALANASKEGKSTSEALSDLQDAMESADSSAEATTEAIELFGSKAGPAIAEACQNGRLDFNDLSTAMTDYIGSVDSTYEATQDGADKIKLAWQGVKTEVGAFVGSMLDEYAPDIEDILDEVKEGTTDLLQVIVDNGPQIKSNISSIIEWLKGKITWLIENFDGIKSVVESIGTVLIATFVVSKITSFITTISTMITTFTALKAATEAAEGAQLLLNAAQLATPIGLVTAAVAGLAAGLLYLASKTEDAENEFETFTEFEQEQIDKTYELRDAYEELSSARDEEISAIETEYDYYEDLAAELDNLVDANGNVKEGYEDRVNFILTTLNEACGTEMELIDGVIENYNEEKDAIESLIETKKAEAVLSASEEAYTEAIQNSNDALQNYITTQGIYNENVSELADLEEEYNSLLGMTSEEYAKMNGLTVSETTASEMLADEQQNLADQIDATKAAIGESHAAMDTAKNTYEDYQQTIANYEGLSSAIISGDSEKISEALTNLEYDFQTAETATRETLEQQVTDYEENLANLEQAIKDGTPGVTQEMVDQASAMVDAAKEELDKLPDEASSSASNAVSLFATTLGSESSKASVKGSAQDLYDTAINAMINDEKTESAGAAFGSGFLNGIGSMTDTVNEGAKNMSSNAVDALNEGQASHSPSAFTTTSGENFGQGFINGMDNKTNSIWDKAWSLAKTALSALSAAQEEGSPSKLTYQSGRYFTQGYINGIASEHDNLVHAVQKMTKDAFTYAFDLKNFDFDDITDTVRDFISDEFDKKTTYMYNKMTYQNQEKIKEFDKTISKLTAELDATEDEALKKQYQEQIDEQERIKTSYETASANMISEFSSALDKYKSKAQDLINATIGGITTAYEKEYNNLISKQNSLINKLKSAGDLFEISGAGIMTVNDIKEQTKNIQEYTSKLQKIKGKVSSELFDQIASYDMDQGNAFMDRLLALSDADLKAYSAAYDEKMSVAQQLSEKTYKKDFEQVEKDYEKTIKDAFNNLPSQLNKLGKEAMMGFINGLTKNTDYMDSEVKTFVAAMVDQFKDVLKIHSPSKVMEQLGDYTGEGFVVGIKNTINSAKAAAKQMVKAVAVPLDGLKNDIGSVKSNVNDSSGMAASSTNIVNNYSLVQNNTSPKSLTALETYQARRQQIALVKAMT